MNSSALIFPRRKAETSSAEVRRIIKGSPTTCKASTLYEIFDGVIAMDILEHIPDDQLAVQELARVMKLGASLFVTVPAFPFLWSKHDEKVSHIRRYRKSEIESLVENNGLKIVNIR